MTQSELNHEIAETTGESIHTIGHMGFVPLTRGPVEIEREPLVLDWDEVPDRRYTLLPV